MPYSLKKKGSKWCVVTTATGKEHGCHDTRAAATKQLAAIRINTKE